MENRSFRFDRHDRIMIDNVSYRSESKEKNTHFLQAIVDGFIDDFLTVKTDQDISLLMKSGRLRVDAGWFSKTLHLLRVRHDNSNLRDLSEDDLRTVAWKKEWCVRFLSAAGAKDKPWRPKMTPTDIRQFIDNIKSEMDSWYLNEFGMRRKPGRQRKGRSGKNSTIPLPAPYEIGSSYIGKPDTGQKPSDPFMKIVVIGISLMSVFVRLFKTESRVIALLIVSRWLTSTKT